MASLLERDHRDVVGVAELGKDVPVCVKTGNVEAGEVKDWRAITVSGGGEATPAVARGRPTCKVVETAMWLNRSHRAVRRARQEKDMCPGGPLV